ncbi:MAG TPA: GNAT family N-acetyltransferase [Candidatus Avanaerovorax faecigallinarum]|nr:GNAT family N-acetyltransferase [Candidatus Avanaerovorax faecigallinarum]
MRIRKYTPSDLPEIAQLFYNTVHTVNAADYGAEQLDAWADGNIDMEKWNKSLESHCSLVATENGVIAGFGDIDETGYLDRLYVHRDYQGRGIGTAICDRLESSTGGKITTHASVTAKPFFLQRGYRVIKEQQVERRGVLLTNFVMEKDSYETKIRITEAECRDAGLTEKLVDVWESSVRATHHFLSDDEIRKIRRSVTWKDPFPAVL